MRRFTLFCFLFPLVLSAQEDCDVFNIQELSAAYLNFSVDSTILQSDGSYEVYLSNGTTYTQVQGCTWMRDLHLEYDRLRPIRRRTVARRWHLTCEPVDGRLHYAVVEIGDQCWFAENLRTTVYADDSSIPEVTGSSAWSGLSTGARCDYNNDAANVAAYGRLYNWYAVTNARGAVPKWLACSYGWRVDGIGGLHHSTRF